MYKKPFNADKLEESVEQLDEAALFAHLIAGAKPLKQDKVRHQPARNMKAMPTQQRLSQEQKNATFYFSDEFQPLLSTDGATRYLRAGADPHQLKQLRRGDFEPELFLDLHGLTQQQAKEELGALIAACQREHVLCACVMTGHGKNILKKQTPLWLAQHPALIAFHQAPKEFGGEASLLLLIELAE